MAMSRGPAPDWLGFWFDTQCSGAKFFVCQMAPSSPPPPALSPPPSLPSPPPPTPPRCLVRGVTWCTDSTGQGGNCCDHGSCSLDAARLLPDPQGIATRRAVCQPSPSSPSPPSPTPVSANMRPCNDPNTWTCPPLFSECITRYSNGPNDPPNVSNCNRVRNYMISSARISGEQCPCA